MLGVGCLGAVVRGLPRIMRLVRQLYLSGYSVGLGVTSVGVRTDG